MRLLIVFGTTEGHTRKICGFIGDEARHEGHQVDICDASDNPPDPDYCDALIIAASLHAGGYQAAVRRYIAEHRDLLNERKTAFVSVSLSAVGTDEKSTEELKQLTENFLNDSGWKPGRVEYVAGALIYSEYSFFKRFIMRMISKQNGGDTDTSKDYEYTDWDQVRRFVVEFAAVKEMAGNGKN